MLGMMLGMVPARVLAMLARVAGMAGCGSGMMSRLLVIAIVMMGSGFPMMMRRLLMMVGGMAMMVCALMLKHDVSPWGSRTIPAQLA